MADSLADLLSTMSVPSSDVTASSRSLSTASQAAVETFDIFTCFPNFPLELRLTIWELALPGPRVLWLCPAIDHSQSEDGSCSFWSCIEAYSISTTHPMQREYCSLIPPVSMLDACKESREVAVRALPHKFPSVTGQEIRFGNMDSVLFDSLRKPLLEELFDGQAIDPRYHSALREIRTLILTDPPELPCKELVLFSEVSGSCPNFTNLRTIILLCDQAPISYKEGATPELNLEEFTGGVFDFALLNHAEFNIYEAFQTMKEAFVTWDEEQGAWIVPDIEVKFVARNWPLAQGPIKHCPS